MATSISQWPSEILRVAEMYAADRWAAQSGVSTLALMEAAGLAVARAVRQRFTKQAVTVLCGPGNNGGDGFVVARYLWDWGWPVQLVLLGDVAALPGDAAAQCRAWQSAGGAVRALDQSSIDDLIQPGALVIDALFGAGLSRGLAGVAAQAVRRIADVSATCIAIDVPSGVHGDSGSVLASPETPDQPGLAPQCELTVTFFRLKPAHVLYPSRALCGEVVVADIGISSQALTDIVPSLFVNDARLWDVPTPSWRSHKHRRGHVVVFGGVDGGATRLAGRAARRMGAGLLTFAVPQTAASLYAQSEPGAFVRALNATSDVDALMDDKRRNTALIGPGYGLGHATRLMVMRLLGTEKAIVLDADALSSFEQDPQLLFDAIHARTAATVLTPHEGEFVRLFSGQGDKLSRALNAAKVSRAVLVLKGADTVIAAPDGRAAININGSSYLATGGSGDVLAGAIAGLLAQGLPSWQAACAAVWAHGAAGDRIGPGLIAEDIADQISI